MSQLLPAPTKTYEVYTGGVNRDMPPPPPKLPSTNTSLSTVLVPQVDTSGEVRFDAIITAQHKSKTSIHTRFSDLIPREASTEIMERPSDESTAAVTERTKAALEGLVSGAMAVRSGVSALGSAAAAADVNGQNKIIRYTPDEDAPGFNPAARTRIIKMVGAAVDPLEPPKFKHKKMPGPPPDAPVPIMHSPTRKITAEDAAAWKIPPCISNYKNPHGFVIPLDKRIAADGRTLLESVINDNRAKLSEAMQIAERKARLEVETRAAIQKTLSLKAKEEAEAEMRALAAKARMERSGVADLSGITADVGGSGGGFTSRYTEGDFEGVAYTTTTGGKSIHQPPVGGGGPRAVDNRPAWMKVAEGGDSAGAPPGLSALLMGGGGGGGEVVEEGEGGAPLQRSAGESEADFEGRLQREHQRREFRKEREREMRMEGGAGRRVGKEGRDGDRDVSERVALGEGIGGGKRGAVAGGGSPL